MAEYHVGCGAFGIYAGTLNKDKTMWTNKSDVTEEAINAVRDYLLYDIKSKGKTKGGYEWLLKNGKKIQLYIEIKEIENDAK